ncbi:MAG: hypothetical protein ACR2H6_01100 [Pyrinomonadaceae bacterium]
MADLTDSELEEIVKQGLPGYKVSPKSQVAKQATETDSVRRGASAARAEDRAETLRRKYLGPDADVEADEDEAADTATFVAEEEEPARRDSAINDEDDEMIVAVEPDSDTDPLDRGSRAKAAVISKKEKKVIGQQG